MADVPGQTPTTVPASPTGAVAALGTEHPAPAAVAAPAAIAPPAAPWGTEGVYKFGEAGKEQPWWTAIPEPEVRATMEAKQYANPAVVAMAYHNLLKLQNGNGDVVSLPPENATPEQLKAFDKRLGAPETVDGYKDLKMGDKPDPKFVDFGKSLALDLGLSPKKAQALVDKWNTFATAEQLARQNVEVTANNDAVDALMKTWGPQAAENQAAGLRVVKAIGNVDLINAVDRAIGAAPVMQLLMEIGKRTSEGTFKGDGAPNGNPNDPSNMTKEAAGARIAALRGDPAFNAKYTDKKHPEHAAAVAEMTALYAKA